MARASATSAGRVVRMWTSVSPSRGGVSNSTVMRRTAIVPPAPLPRRISSSKTGPVSGRPPARLPPAVPAAGGHPLLEARPGPGPAAGPPLAHPLDEEGGPVLPDHEAAVPLDDAEEEVGRAEVAVGDPDVSGPDRFQDLTQQRPLLGMAVLAAEHVGDEHRLRVEHDQGLARQGTGPDGAKLLEPVLGPGQVVTVEDLDPVAGQPGRPLPTHGGDDRPQGAGG